MNTQEAINYYKLDPEIASKMVKRMGFDEMNEYQTAMFVNNTLNQMQKKLAMKIAKEMGIRPTKAMRILQAMDIFHEEDIDYDAIGERI